MTCHVTTVSCTSSLSKSKIKKTRKENQYKIRKIKEKKNKIVSVQVFHNIRVGQKKESCIEFIQENLIENSVQDSLC